MVRNLIALAFLTVSAFAGSQSFSASDTKVKGPTGWVTYNGTPSTLTIVRRGTSTTNFLLANNSWFRSMQMSGQVEWQWL
jgi:hypothetical protein